MNSDRFSELLNLYLNDKATRQELEDLMLLIRQGDYDETIRDTLDTMLLNDAFTEEMDRRKAGETLKKILTRANAQEKIIPMRRLTLSWRWVATASILVSAVSAGWWYSRAALPPPQLPISHEKEPEPASFRGKQFVRLPDGSTVLLNEGSELTYSTSFGQGVRKVILIGEGYFDVRHDASKPFQVVTGKITCTVLGTAFNVKAYPGDQEIKVTVTRGRVQVGDDNRTFGIITPDQQISVNRATNNFIKSNLKAETAEAWKSEYLVLDNVSMKEAARTIGEKYHVKIMLANDDLMQCRITATFLNGENLDQVLTVVSGVVQATYSRQADGSVKIEGKGCKS